MVEEVFEGGLDGCDFFLSEFVKIGRGGIG